MISENRVISHLTRKPWVTQPGEPRAIARESTLPTVLRQVLWLFLETDCCQRKISRPSLGWGLAQQMKQEVLWWTESLLLSYLPSLTRDLQTPPQTSRNTIPCGEPHSPILQCVWPTTCCVYPEGPTLCLDIRAVMIQQYRSFWECYYRY